MLEKRTPIQVTEALQKIMGKVKQGKKETIPLSAADGRYLAEDLIAHHPVPFFDRTPLDGFAIRAEDTQGACFEHPIQLKVIQTIGAGHMAEQKVGKGEAIRIMTGAPIPEGADAIVMLELTEESKHQGNTWIKVNRSFQPGDNIVRRGEDTEEGTILARAGRRISAGEMAMLATFGYSQVTVYQQPIIGIYATGTELLPVDAPLEPGKIRNSNSYMLESQIRRLGAIPKDYGILPDEFELCYQSVVEALHEVDYLITTGGVSVGDFDYIPAILKKLGATLLFNKIAMRPGSVTTVALKEEKWIFGLSGNPAACYVGFELFTRPVLRKALGSPIAHLTRTEAILQHDIFKANPFTRFIRAKAVIEGHQVQVSTVGVDKSGVASALVESNALLIGPGGTNGLTKGDKVEIIWLDRPNEGN